MEYVTVAEIKEINPELTSAFNDAQIQGWIDLATLTTPVNVWNELHRNALVLLIQHFLSVELEQVAMTASVVTGLATGQATRSNAPNLESSLDGTAYGQQYKYLRNILGTTIGFRG